MPVRRWLATTPGRLRLASIVLVAALVLVGVVAGLATTARRDATRSVADEGTTELVTAENLIAALADADAATSTAYLRPGIEPQDLRQRYDDDIETAGRYLARLAAATGTAPDARRAVQTISKTLPTYTAKIEASRANDRLGKSVSSSYLRSASMLMREEILPAATVVYTHASGRLDDAYRSGTSMTEIALVAGVGAIALAVLIGLQLYLFARMHRMFNMALAAATGVLVVLLVWTLVAFGSQQSDLVGAQRHGSDAVQVLSATRILALRAHNDDNLVLIERGGGEQYLADYEVMAARIGGDHGHGGLLDVADRIAARGGATERIDGLRARYVDVRTAHDAVRQADDDGHYEDAVAIANQEKAPAVDAFDRDVGIEIARARVELDQRAVDARSGFDVLLIVIPVLTAGAALLVLVGLQRRIGEYR
jgi:hypothetical protein